MRRAIRFSLMVGGLAFAAFDAPVSAQMLTAEISSDDAFIGEVLTVSVTVSNPSQATAPAPPVSNDFEVRLLSVEPVGRSSRVVMDGRGQMTQQADYTYQFSARPLHGGVLTLGRFTLRDKGRIYSSQPIRVTVSSDKTGQDVFCEITAKREVAYLGQPVLLSYEIWIRRYNQPGLGILEVSTMWGLKDPRASTWGVFSQTDIERLKWGTSQRDVENGHKDDFYVFFIETTVYPAKAGPFDFGDIEFVYNYPVRIGRNVFNLTLERSRKVSVRPKTPKLIIKPIPQEDRPPDYSGAIGVYSIFATAKPTQVPVGDPITLTLSIRGDGPLDRISPPRLDRVQALTRDFEVSTDVPAGSIEGERKKFSVTIRSLREDVKVIPAIPLSFFNPESERFETAHSTPIPIKVTPAQRIALSHLPASEGGDSNSGILAPLVETSEGLFSNETDPRVVLADQSADLGPVAWSLLAVMPLAYATTSVLCARSARFRRDQAYRRRSRAFSTAKKALATGDAVSPARLRAVLVGYIADRCNVPSGGLTRADAVKLLSDRGVSPDVMRAADVLLEQLELSEYAGASTNSPLDGADAGRRLVEMLERERLQ